jgi:hypothetical protein
VSASLGSAKVTDDSFWSTAPIWENICANYAIDGSKYAMGIVLVQGGVFVGLSVRIATRVLSAAPITLALGRRHWYRKSLAIIAGRIATLPDCVNVIYYSLLHFRNCDKSLLSIGVLSLVLKHIFVTNNDTQYRVLCV